METNQNSLPFAKRFLIYQKERFPFLAHGALISSFTFSAISYSRLCRGEEGFIPLKEFGIGIFITISLFFLVRIFDEFKDKEDDAKYRQYLPVPRGLISFRELNIMGAIALVLQFLALLVFQWSMIGLYIIVLCYLLLMRVEFFIPEWLKRHQAAYVISHMMIIPLIDLYASGLDWKLEQESMHLGLLWFFCLSFFNGIVLEIGRKIRAPEGEEEGVVSYTSLYGTKGAVVIWLVMLTITLAFIVGAMNYAHYGIWSYVAIVTALLGASTPGIMFLRSSTQKNAKVIEKVSGIWAILMYLIIGAFPMLTNLLSS